MQVFKNILHPLAHLFYPHTCTGCGSDLIDKDNQLCLRCISQLPYTRFEQHANNPVEKLFYGRIKLEAASSCFYFTKEELVQHLIHQLKYKSNRDIGIYLGQLMGMSLLQSNRFQQIDALVPLPLFAAKERRRGYNQAAVICEGMIEILKIPVVTGNVIRQRFTETQTKKHRAERWKNVEDSFTVLNPQALTGKNVLLVDDVVTTGATLEACGQTLLQQTDCKLSVATLAHAIR